MILSAAPRLIALLGLLSLASCPAAAQSRPHGFHASPLQPPPHAAYPGAYGRARTAYPPPAPYGSPLRSPYADRPYPYAYPPPPAAYAPAFGAGYGGTWRAEQDEVRRAVRDGRHVPLSQAIAAVRQRTPGHVLDAGVEGGPDGRAVYRLRWATNGGRRIDYLVDAATGAIVGVQGGR